MLIRAATSADAAEMSRVLRAIIAASGRERPGDIAFVLAQYIDNFTGIRCSVAVSDSNRLLGFQSLVRATPGNRYHVPDGWGIIGTHIGPDAHRQGVGKALFAASLAAATAAGIEAIDAYIGADNATGLAYYAAMGFTTYHKPPGIVQKVYRLG
ncbi:GNAT superfamily N-acetyltransferase [Sphingomonas jinjuensis]|uniref:GNAT superfamily N-acetyltransferase n=1 Tax=Sphingomonas jinjuensis TaxID=535907 RepID=A0A840F289_9SPHN|nr:GNAT family N-acetyltransferase [Sphingomonas jinjuensis]MBB4153473.1 GNAT superfamily N-acetyltransferase [Sphingomonas jinjuensis]